MRAPRYLVCLAGAAAVALACGGGSGDDEPPPDGPSDPAVVFPGDDWAHGDARDLGFDPATLDRIAGEARANGSTCLLVVRHGRIAGEWYGDGTDAGTRHDAYSVTKSYTSTLVGIAAHAGHVDVDDRASEHIPAWRGTPSEDVTVRHLLANVSGRHSPLRDDLTDLADFLAAPDATAYAVGLAQDHPPGTVWSYNDPAIQTLDAVLAESTGEEPAAYARRVLLDPIGARTTEMATDDAGNTRMASSLRTTCRDAARFGHLILQDGIWEGTRVVPEEWVRQATRPSQELFPAYGYLWWLNRPSSRPLDTDGAALIPDHAAVVADRAQLVPGAPDDMVWAVGAFGQIVQVDPGSGTVVVRFGAPDPAGQSGLHHLDTTTSVVTEALAPATSRETADGSSST